MPTTTTIVRSNADKLRIDLQIFLQIIIKFCGDESWGRLLGEHVALEQLHLSAWGIGRGCIGQCQATVEEIIEKGSNGGREKMLQAFLDHQHLLPIDFEMIVQVYDAILNLDGNGLGGAAADSREYLLNKIIKGEVDTVRQQYLEQHKEAYLELLNEVYGS